DAAGWVAEAQDFLPRSRVPDPHDAIHSARGEMIAIATERDGIETAIKTTERPDGRTLRCRHGCYAGESRRREQSAEKQRKECGRWGHVPIFDRRVETVCG